MTLSVEYTRPIASLVRITRRFVAFFHVFISAQAVAFGFCAKIDTLSLKPYLYILDEVSRNFFHSSCDLLKRLSLAFSKS
ncbi:MAG: hypothetical protein ACLSAQ_07210 [[Eubacterium] siraeum]